MSQAILSKLKFQIGADNRQFLSSIQQSQKKIVGFQGGITKFAKIAGGAFAAIQLGGFIKDLIKISEEAKGVEIAFNALNSPTLLSELRAATKGTVSDLELMKKSVQAHNFQIPIEKLGIAFEFARKREAATGVSVDFLTQSIIDGIGRKSSLVLDNLGISASQLQAEMKKTGDFATAAFNLIEEGARSMPDALDAAVSGTQQLSVAWDNVALSIAKAGRNNFFNQIQQGIINRLGDIAKLFKPDEKITLANILHPDLVITLPTLDTNLEPLPALLEEANQKVKNLHTAISTAPTESMLAGFNRDLVFANAELERLKTLGTTAFKRFDISKITGSGAESIGIPNRIKDTFNIPDNLSRVGLTVIPKLNKDLKVTDLLIGNVSNAFGDMFGDLINKSKETEDIFKNLAIDIIPALLRLIPGPAGLIASGLAKGVISSVTRGGDIKHSGALVSRNRSFSS